MNFPIFPYFSIYPLLDHVGATPDQPPWWLAMFTHLSSSNALKLHVYRVRTRFCLSLFFQGLFALSMEKYTMVR